MQAALAGTASKPQAGPGKVAAAEALAAVAASQGSTGPRFCEQCGKPRGMVGKFCTSCGAKFAT
jgi:hypothetical protein